MILSSNEQHISIERLAATRFKAVSQCSTCDHIQTAIVSYVTIPHSRSTYQLGQDSETYDGNLNDLLSGGDILNPIQQPKLSVELEVATKRLHTLHLKTIPMTEHSVCWHKG